MFGEQADCMNTANWLIVFLVDRSKVLTKKFLGEFPPTNFHQNWRTEVVKSYETHRPPSFRAPSRLTSSRSLRALCALRRRAQTSWRASTGASTGLRALAARRCRAGSTPFTCRSQSTNPSKWQLHNELNHWTRPKQAGVHKVLAKCRLTKWQNVGTCSSEYIHWCWAYRERVWKSMKLASNARTAKEAHWMSNSEQARAYEVFIEQPTLLNESLLSVLDRPTDAVERRWINPSSCSEASGRRTVRHTRV